MCVLYISLWLKNTECQATPWVVKFHWFPPCRGLPSFASCNWILSEGMSSQITQRSLCMFFQCPHGFSWVNSVSSHIPKHTGRCIGYTKLSPRCECVYMVPYDGLGIYPGCISCSLIFSKPFRVTVYLESTQEILGVRQNYILDGMSVHAGHHAHTFTYSCTPRGNIC